MRNFETDPLRVAMLGMIPENYHPYSWSAIINGFDPLAMKHCPAPVIYQYLSKQSPGSVGIPFAKVTHIWTDDPEESAAISAASLIPHVVSEPKDILGEVEALIISTDDGDDHVRRVAPFVEAGLPIFVDKPLATNLADLRQFVKWRHQGAAIISSSGLRYSPELEPLRGKSWRWITGTTCKSWERYGIHALEPIYTLTGPGFTRVRARRVQNTTFVEAEHESGTLVSLAAIERGFGSAFVIHGYADEMHYEAILRDSYSAFRSQLLGFLAFASGREPEPHPFAHTVELMTMIIAARLSAERGEAEIDLSTII